MSRAVILLIHIPYQSSVMVSTCCATRTAQHSPPPHRDFCVICKQTLQWPRTRRAQAQRRGQWRCRRCSRRQERLPPYCPPLDSHFLATTFPSSCATFLPPAVAELLSSLYRGMGNLRGGKEHINIQHRFLFYRCYLIYLLDFIVIVLTLDNIQSKKGNFTGKVPHLQSRVTHVPGLPYMMSPIPNHRHYNIWKEICLVLINYWRLYYTTTILKRHAIGEVVSQLVEVLSYCLEDRLWVQIPSPSWYCWLLDQDP